MSFRPGYFSTMSLFFPDSIPTIFALKLGLCRGECNYGVARQTPIWTGNHLFLLQPWFLPSAKVQKKLYLIDVKMKFHMCRKDYSPVTSHLVDFILDKSCTWDCNRARRVLYLRFWNHIFIWLSVSLKVIANFALSSLDRYLKAINL